MKILIVGGNFDDIGGKPSSIVKKIWEQFEESTIINGGSIVELPLTVEDNDLVIWMPNIPNIYEKNYPKKSKGAVLICSKFMKDDNRGEAVSRIFKMNANAIMAIYKEDIIYRFELLDALGNLWCDTYDIKELYEKILKLTKWTNDSIRIDSKLVDYIDDDVKNFCDVVRKVSEKVEKERGGRYFGNCSTRCSYMFPSTRGALVSTRNTPKDYIKPEDLIPVRFSFDKNGFESINDTDYVLYSGDKKPSVDTPIQLELYHYYDNINYFIHGHAYIEEAETTANYYPCGDLREADEITNTLRDYRRKSIILNLKNHGFLIGTSTVEEMNTLIETLTFKFKYLGESV